MLIALDIETITPEGKGVTQGEIDHFLATYERKYKKPDVIEKHREEDLQKFILKKNLKAGVPQVIAVGLGRVHPYNGELQDPECRVSSNEKELIEFFLEYVEKTINAKAFLGFGMESFDMVHLCGLLERYDMAAILRPSKWGVVDPSNWPLNRRYKLKDICNAWGIKSKDEELNALDGGDVADLWDTGNHKRLQEYCALDVWRVARLYKALSRLWKLV